MPHNNRMSGSSALNTSAIWKDVIKYDPYAGNEGETKSTWTLSSHDIDLAS